MLMTIILIVQYNNDTMLHSLYLKRVLLKNLQIIFFKVSLFSYNLISLGMYDLDTINLKYVRSG